MFSLLKKEINSFLTSIIGYAVIVVFLLINGLFLWVIPYEYNILDFGFAGLDNFFKLAPWVFLFLIPAITMKAFAEEQKSGTIELLLTKPLSDLAIVLAKYFSCLLLVVISVLPTIVYVISVYQLGLPAGNLDMGGTLGSYIGLLLLASGFVAIGIFASVISDNVIVAFLIALFLCGFTYIGFSSISSLSFFGRFDLFIQQLGIQAHYSSLSRGVIDTRDVIYFMSLVSLFLLLTKFMLERRKW